MNMNQQRSDTGLSTADMVAGIDRQSDEQAAQLQTTRPGDGAMGTDRRADEHRGPNGTTTARSGNQTPLLAEGKAAGFRERWSGIQAGFVDEPRQAVEQADGLVAEAIKQLAEVFAEERSTLEEQWSCGDEVSTDDLRLGLQRYRSFFERLLAV